MNDYTKIKPQVPGEKLQNFQNTFSMNGIKKKQNAVTYIEDMNDLSLRKKRKE